MFNEKGKDVNNTFTYNLLGNVKTASNGNVQQSFTYNDVGLLKRKNTVINGTTFLAENFYKEFGMPSAETYEKNGKRYSKVEYTTDIYGRKVSAKFTEGLNVVLNAEYTYDKNSNITEIKDNNMTRKYEYNKANFITGVTNINNKNVKTSYRYSYYPDGNIAHYVNHYNATMDYTYDSANRVVKEVYGEDANMPFTIGYTYDEFGNLSKKDYRDDDNPAYVTTYSYDKNNRLTKESQIVSNGSTKWQNITTYGYDKNGNRLNRIKYKQNVDNTKFKLNLTDSAYKYYDYGKEVYTYDGLNELKTYRGKKEEFATYEYMANHYRISKTVDGTKTYQLWDNDRVVSEFDSELNLKINYRIGVNGQILSDSNEISYSYDGHGNLINENGNYSTNVYDAYGNKTEDFGTGDAPFGYCGEYTDKESGLVYLRNRYYDSSTGSFITEDPIKDGNNWYGYCAGNPLNAWDTSGLDWYVFYDPTLFHDGENRAKEVANSINSMKEYKDTTVWRVSMSSKSEQDFINRWNKMGTHKGEGAIDGVVILAHGNENGFRTVCDKKNKVYGERITTSTFRRDDMEIKKMDYFIFLSCDAGADSGDDLPMNRRGDENIAMGVSRSKQEIKTVIASSTNVNHGEHPKVSPTDGGSFKTYTWNTNYTEIQIKKLKEKDKGYDNVKGILKNI